jgi:ribosomal protein L11 methyltransferase
MYLWQRLAASSWWEANQDDVRVAGGPDLVTVERPGRKRLIIEISCRTRAQANRLQRRFGGRVVKLQRNWLKQFVRGEKSNPLGIGSRLIVTNAGGTSASRIRVGRSHLVIPAGAAFGTGQHSTTAMSLRLLEQLTRSWPPGWSMIDLGTGSGILALAAKTFGARHVVGIDIDPVAISTAKGNAELNGIAGVHFKVADVLKWRPPAAGPKIVTANLFSELLIAILPRLRRVPWLILSGAMREQEHEVVEALNRNRMEILQTKRRGRWIALVIKRDAG